MAILPSNMLWRRLAAAALVSGSCSVCAGPTVELSAEASRPAPNDLVRAVLFSEASARSPADVARKVNGEIAEALRIVKAAPAVTGKTGNVHTYPIYGKNQAIESWRMRAEIILESQDTNAVSELIGRLQGRLALGAVSVSPSDATRRRVEDDATRDAITEYRRRAQVVADALGKPYRIKQLAVGQSGAVVPMLRAARGMAVAADAAPLPMEAGESQITVTVSGQIELQD